MQLAGSSASGALNSVEKSSRPALQSFRWAVRAPAGVMVEGALYWRLLERSGLFNAAVVREELSREIGYFHVAAGEIPCLGIDLKVNQLV